MKLIQVNEYHYNTHIIQEITGTKN